MLRASLELPFGAEAPVPHYSDYKLLAALLQASLGAALSPRQLLPPRSSSLLQGSPNDAKIQRPSPVASIEDLSEGPAQILSPQNTSVTAALWVSLPPCPVMSSLLPHRFI